MKKVKKLPQEQRSAVANSRRKARSQRQERAKQLSTSADTEDHFRSRYLRRVWRTQPLIVEQLEADLAEALDETEAEVDEVPDDKVEEDAGHFIRHPREKEHERRR